MSSDSFIAKSLYIFSKDFSLDKKYSWKNVVYLWYKPGKKLEQYIENYYVIVCTKFLGGG